jgi:hypothetical protein
MRVDYCDPDKAATPKQHREIAEAACRLLGLPAPSTRLAAEEALVRVRLAEVKKQGSKP